MMNVLITGATGFLGQDLLRALLDQEPDLRAICLVRARDEAALERRRQRLVEPLGEAQAGRVELVRGDIEQDRLGLDAGAYGQLAERVDRVLHVAATTNFDHSLEEARRINVGGTRHSLELCRAVRAQGRLGRLDYVGTAYVAGTRTDRVLESELDRGQGFRNTYERSKFEAERLCREAMGELPVALHRPSIIVGNSRTGITTSYKTIYWPMKMLFRLYGLWRPVMTRLVRLPVRPDCLLDIVPVDFVANGVARLFADPQAAGRCFHLAAGDEAVTIEQLVNHCCDHFQVPRLRYLDPQGPVGQLGRAAQPLFERLSPRITKNAALMAAYTIQNPRFDTQNARAAGLRPPNIAGYFSNLIQYAYDNNFGSG